MFKISHSISLSIPKQGQSIELTDTIYVNEAIILAAGFGSRLKELTKKIPKALLKIGSKSMLQCNIEQLIKAKITKIYIVTGYKSNLIRDHVFKLRKIFDVQLCLVHNPYYYLGNGRSLLASKNLIKSPYCLLTMVDNYPDYNVFIRTKEAVSTIGKVNGIGLCIDRLPRYNFQINDATKVSIKNDKINNIGKKIENYDGLDMGVFLLNMKELKKINIEKGRSKLTITDIMKYWINEMKRPFIPIDCSGLFWTDIDSKVDLKFTMQAILSKTSGHHTQVGLHG